MAIPSSNHLYDKLWKVVKHQMLARDFRKIPISPDHHFQQIVSGMRALCPVYHSLVTAAAANNRTHMRQINKVVVQLVKDGGVGLRTMVKNGSTGRTPLGQDGIFYDQVMLSDR